MKTFALFTLASIASAGNVLDFINKELCSSDSCVTSGLTISNICGENGNTDYNCLCNNMPNSFYQDMYNCTESCEMLDHLGGSSSGSDVRDFYCRLATARAESMSASSLTSLGSSSSSGGSYNTNYCVSIVCMAIVLLI